MTALILSFVLFATGCGKTEVPAAQTSIRVVSFNIRSEIEGSNSDGENSWEYRKWASPAMIKDVAPDVFGLQEARPHQLAFLRQTLSQYNNVGVGRDDGNDAGEHMSVFYNRKRLKLLAWGTWWLSETPETPSIGWDAAYKRTATWVKFEDRTCGKEFFFVDTHLDHRGAEAKRKGLELIVSKIAQMNPDGLPLVLMGDFNVTPEDESLQGLNQVMKSARETAADSDDKPSFNDWGTRFKIIDYIYWSGFSSCTNFKVIDKTYNKVPYISDHYPIMADFEF